MYLGKFYKMARTYLKAICSKLSFEKVTSFTKYFVKNEFLLQVTFKDFKEAPT